MTRELMKKTTSTHKGELGEFGTQKANFKDPEERK